MEPCADSLLPTMQINQFYNKQSENGPQVN